MLESETEVRLKSDASQRGTLTRIKRECGDTVNYQVCFLMKKDFIQSTN